MGIVTCKLTIFLVKASIFFRIYVYSLTGTHMQKQQIKNQQVLEEGLWSKTKYIVGKLGRLEKGGKIVGRGKQAAAAAAQVENTLQKESAKMLKGLVNVVKQHYPEFPNMEDHTQFLGACELYTSFYDSMAAGPKFNPNEDVFIPAVVANAAILDLRVIWKHFLDYQLSSVYNTMNEANTVNASLGAASAGNPSNPISSFNHDSTTMATLKSNKLPILLATLGSSLGAFGWILKTPFMQDWLNHLFDHTKDIASYVNSNQVLGMVGNGEGITQTLGRLYPGVDLGPNASVENLHKVLSEIGGGNEDSGMKAISGMLKNPQKITDLKQMLGSGKYHTIKELFNQHAGDPTSGKGGSWFETIKDGKLSVSVKEQIIKTVAVQGIKAGAIGAGIGSFLAPLGIALVAAGITTKLLRMKGQKSSRAQIMNDLLLSWELLPMDDDGSQAMQQLGVVKQDQTGLATTNQETGVSVQGQGDSQGNPRGNPQRNAIGPRKSSFNSDASDIEDAQIVNDDEPVAQAAIGSGQVSTPDDSTTAATAVATDDNDDNGTAPDRGPDGSQGVGAPKAANSGLVGRLDPNSNKNAAANIQAFGDTITSADKRSQEDVSNEILGLTAAIKEIPAQVIMPKVVAIQKLLKSGDVASQLKAVKAFRAMSAYIKNLYVASLKNYSEDTANILRKDMAYSGGEGLKKKPQPVNTGQTSLPLNESYTTSLFNAAAGKEDILLGTLGQICVKLINQLTAGTALSKEQIQYLSQKLSSSGKNPKNPSAPIREVGLVQKIIKEINKWLSIRLTDYKAYMKYLKKSGAGAPRKGAPASAAPEEAGEPVPMNEGLLNPFFIKESVETLNSFYKGGK